jgi:hypothetical protein
MQVAIVKKISIEKRAPVDNLSEFDRFPCRVIAADGLMIDRYLFHLYFSSSTVAY